MVSLTFSLYQDQDDSVPLWSEIQNVSVDASGGYIVLLGIEHAGGIPFNLFTSGQAKWLGVQADNEPEEPRSLLISVPYAIKAADAEMLGGLPPSAYMRSPLAISSAVSADAGSTPGMQQSITARTVTSASGPAPLLGFLPMFDSTGALVPSTLYENSGQVGLGTTSPITDLTVGGSGRISAAEGNALVFTTRPQGGTNQDRLFIGSDGLIGIGTDLPIAQLTVPEIGAPEGTSLALLAKQVGKNSTVGLLVAANGNVGVGTTAPITDLTVGGSSRISASTTNSLTFGTQQAAGTYRDQMIISAGGNVGIGTLLPSAQLEVGGDVKASNGGRFIGDGSGLINLDAAKITGTVAITALPSNIAQTDTTNVFAKDQNFSGSINASRWQTPLGNSFFLTTGLSGDVNHTRLYVGPDGKVGVSSIQPLTDLTVGGSSRISPAEGNALVFATRVAGSGVTSDRMLIGNNGQVGIGTDVPSTMLEVAGSIKASNGGRFVGDGSGLANISAAQLFGTVPDSSLSANVARIDARNTFTTGQVFSGGLQTSKLVTSMISGAGMAAMVPDNADIAHSYYGQAGSQMHFRLSRGTPALIQPNAMNFMISPYSYGMVFEYPGWTEWASRDFSVHVNASYCTRGLDWYNDDSCSAGARLWVGDKLDYGGLYVSSWLPDNASTPSDSLNGYVLLAADRFDHQGHGEFRFAVRNPADSFKFQSGAMDQEVTQAKISASGKGFFNGGAQVTGGGYAEAFNTAPGNYTPGNLMAIDPSASRQMTLSSGPYSKLVAGVYSTSAGLYVSPYGMDDPSQQAQIPVVVHGVVQCNVDAENGPISPGDLLVSSSTPGYAMKGTDPAQLTGAVVGKALDSLPSGNGTISILVTLQ